MIKNHLSHKRNISESVQLDPKTKNAHINKQKKLIISQKQKNQHKNKNNILLLVEKSNRNIIGKRTVIQDIQVPDEHKSKPFFAFGQKVDSHVNCWNLNMEKISQVQDSNSRRDFTSHRSARNHNKENINFMNIDEEVKRLTKSRVKRQKTKQKQPKQPKIKNEKSKSTNSLSKLKNSKELCLRTQKMQKSMKMLWECMGQLWQNSRVSQYKSEQNIEEITNLKRKLQEQDQVILQLKCEFFKTEKDQRYQKKHQYSAVQRGLRV